MLEGANIELAHEPSKGSEGESSGKRHRSEFAEILEVILLAAVAIATAWSGYQTARWDGRQAYLYDGVAAADRGR